MTFEREAVDEFLKDKAKKLTEMAEYFAREAKRKPKKVMRSAAMAHVGGIR